MLLRAFPLTAVAHKRAKSILKKPKTFLFIFVHLLCFHKKLWKDINFQNQVLIVFLHKNEFKFQHPSFWIKKQNFTRQYEKGTWPLKLIYFEESSKSHHFPLKPLFYLLKFNSSKITDWRANLVKDFFTCKFSTDESTPIYKRSCDL